MKKLNNKGVTLIELIVSFAIVGVAVFYLFQTLYAVKKVYKTARDETQSFVDKNYTLRILDAYLDQEMDIREFCNIGLCEGITGPLDPNSKIKKYEVQMRDGTTVNFYKYISPSGGDLNAETSENNIDVADYLE